ncbi:MAG: MATE family efflux transporter [bacterium]|nr:MATE family efflux transporter [bacterium]
MALNVLVSFFTRGSVAVISLLLVPILLKLLTKEEFGTWQTITSVISWFYFLDIGLGNGLKNLFALSLAENDEQKAKEYLSTTYALTGIVSIGFLVLFELFFPFISWTGVFNTSKISINTFQWVIQFVFIAFGFKLFFSVLTSTLIANQQFGASTFIDFFSNILILVFTWLLSFYEIKSLFWISFVFSFSPIFIFILGHIYFYGFNSLKHFRPSFLHIKFSLSKVLFGKGLQFFFIQIAFVLLFAANNMVVSQLFGPQYVVDLSVLNKLFSIPMMGYLIVLGPFWSGFTIAYHKNDFAWIRVTIKRLLFIWSLFFAMILGMVFFFDEIAQFWLGSNRIHFSSLVILYGVFASLSSFNNIFSYFLNGVGALRVQLIASVILSIVSIPLSVFMCKLPGLGVNGVLVSNIICLLVSAIIGPLQCYFLIYKKARGIWIN